MSTDPAGAPPPSAAVIVRHVPLERDMSPAFREALRTGRAEQLVASVQRTSEIDEPTALAVRVAQHLIEIRRSNVAVLGAHEVFVRRTDRGDLHQVIRPVDLSIAGGHMYQIPKTVWLDWDTGQETTVDRYKDTHNGRWPKKTTVPMEPDRASLEVQGYRAINAVAGCIVIEPDMVQVDKVSRPNPWIQRGPKPKTGGIGDIEEIIVARVIVGPLPDTGTPFAVRYTLRYDPRSDLHAILGGVAATSDGAAQCFLAPQALADEHIAKNGGWTWVPLFGGVGYLCNLRDRHVTAAWNKYGNILANALKKALTVAERNAMRAHPALGRFSRVPVDKQGRAKLAITGWAMNDEGLRQFLDLAARAAKGEPLANVTVVDERYDDTDAEAGAHPQDAPVEPVEGAAPVADARSADEQEKGQLISLIDQAIGAMSPSDVQALNYDPSSNTIDELRAIATRVQESR